jgi:hypothetical protein
MEPEFNLGLGFYKHETPTELGRYFDQSNIKTVFLRNFA